MSYGTLSLVEQKMLDNYDFRHIRQEAHNDALADMEEEIWKEDYHSHYSAEMVEEAISEIPAMKLLELFNLDAEPLGLEIKAHVEKYWDELITQEAERRLARISQESLKDFYFASRA